THKPSRKGRTASCSKRRCCESVSTFRVLVSRIRLPMPVESRTLLESFPSSSGRPSPLAALAAALPTIVMNSMKSSSVASLSRLEGDWISDRQDCGKAGRRLQARRNPERHYQGNTGEFRADD